MVSRLLIGLTVLLALALPAAAAAQDVAIDVTPTVQSAEVGTVFEVRAAIANPGAAATRKLTAHLEIIDPTRAGNVDAEDWVPDLNQTIAPLGPGERREVSWSLKPISGGQFAVYVVALPESAGSAPDEAVIASAAIPVDVSEVRTLNLGGALPVALLVPLFLAGALVTVRWMPRRRARNGGAAAAGTSSAA